MPLQGAAVRVPFALWSLVAGAAAMGAVARCCCQNAVCALELRWCQGVALELGCWCHCRVLFAHWGLVADAACSVPVEGAAVRVLCPLWSLVAGAAAGCPCRVPLAGCRCKVLL